MRTIPATNIKSGYSSRTRTESVKNNEIIIESKGQGIFRLNIMLKDFRFAT